MAGWHNRCDGHELGQTSGDGEGQGGLVCRKEWDTTGQLNNNNQQSTNQNFRKSYLILFDKKLIAYNCSILNNIGGFVVFIDSSL